MPNVIHERLLPKFNFWFKQFSMEFCFGNFLFIKEFCTFFWRKEWDFNCLLIDFFLFQFWWKSGFWFWMYGFLLKFLKLRHYCNAFGSVDLCMVENLFFFNWKWRIFWLWGKESLVQASEFLNKPISRHNHVIICITRSELLYRLSMN